MARSTAKSGNPFGLVDTRVLDELRRGEELAQDTITRNRLSGIEYGASVAGTLLGRVLGDATGRKGPRVDRAAEVTAAQQRARAVIESKPEEVRSSSIHGQRIEEGMALIQQLHAAGLTQEADTVRTSLLDLEKQDLELKKLEGEVAGQREQTLGRRIDRLYDEATINDRVSKTRSEALESDVRARTAVSTERYKVPMAQVEFEQKLQDLGQDRAMAPYIQAKARQDATIAEIQARFGGAPTNLVRNQAARDHILAHLVKNPTDVWAKQSLDEINREIESDSLNAARNINNYQPTNAVLTDVQSSLMKLGSFSEQATTILKTMENTNAEAFGGVAETLTAAAGWANQGLSFLGMSQDLSSRVAKIIASDDVLDMRAGGRQLRADLVNWLSSSGRTSETDVKIANDLLQVFDNPSVDNRQASIALTKFVRWALEHQERDIRVLDQGLKGVVPVTQGSLAEQLEAYQQGQ